MRVVFTSTSRRRHQLVLMVAPCCFVCWLFVASYHHPTTPRTNTLTNKCHLKTQHPTTTTTPGQAGDACSSKAGPQRGALCSGPAAADVPGHGEPRQQRGSRSARRRARGECFCQVQDCLCCGAKVSLCAVVFATWCRQPSVCCWLSMSQVVNNLLCVWVITGVALRVPSSSLLNYLNP